jgi:two-component system CheB/CheR fusion protein
VESERRTAGCPVAGLVASAGGLSAFKKFFDAMPADSGVAFVLIPHLAPDHASLMVELLARDTKMPVVEATEGLAVEANHVYILPPNKYMTISGGVLRLTGPVERGGMQTSIDLFLRSLAKDKQEKAICVILSGTGSHGSLGLKAVKASDGMAMVQDPNTAECPRMPESAIATGLADYVLPVEQMPEALLKYVQHRYVNELKIGTGVAEASDHLDQILTLLRARTKLDFRCYRKKMLTRRIERRMSLSHFNQIADYLAFLGEHPDEVKQLVRDLLISMTSFFRDPEAFQSLETEVVAPLIRAKAPDAPVRVWSAGCATGEEAYSLGIVLLEQLAAAQVSCQVQIFASDVDEAALEIARRGMYPETIDADISHERLGRFFTRLEDGSYQVSKQLREIVIFARQNLISDASFSKLDLVVCRNLLIYLEPEIQQKAIALAHFALNEGGILFLGPSETIGRQVDLFELVSKKWRIFRRIGLARPERIEIPITAAADPLVSSRRSMQLSTARPVSFADMTHRLLLDQYAPPAVLINRKYEILYFFGPTDRYLAVPAGEPTQDLMMLAREGLRAKLRAAIHRAARENGPITLADAQVKRDGDIYPVIITVSPIQGPHGAKGLLLITFQDSEQAPAPHPLETVTEESVARQLEFELNATKEDLQGAVEELGNFNEELKSSNEEIMSMNEELQSANEELETSKEEMQSLNEELTTVNSQLQDKVADLELANNDMANLLKCSDVAIIFLDRQFRIKRFTPPATRVFNLIATDVDRPISDITPKFPDVTLQQDIANVLRISTPQEKQLETPDGCCWNRRIIPYRTLDDRIEGVILTFTDVTHIRRADERERRLATVLMDSNDAVTVHDFDGKITAWNRGAERMFGYSEAEALQMNVEQIIPEELIARARGFWERMRRGELLESRETQRRTKDGRILDVLITATMLKDQTGTPVAIANTKRDITVQKRVDQESRRKEAELIEAQHIAHIGSWSWDPKTDTATGSDELFRIFGLDPITDHVPGIRELRGRIIHAATWRRLNAAMQESMRTGVGYELEVEMLRGSAPIWITTRGEVVRNAEGQIVGLRGTVQDITERKKGEELSRESERFARSTLDGLSAAIAILDESGIILAVNRPWRDFAAANLASPEAVNEGANYLSVCDRSGGQYSEQGPLVAAGIRAVMAKQNSEFSIEYPCHSPQEERWFQMRVTLFPGDGPCRVVVAHEDITRRKLLEREVVEIASLEQRRIGQDLHDECGQQLTALGLLADGLADSLANDAPTIVDVANKIEQGIKNVLRQVRNISRGLALIEINPEELPSALADLTSRLSETSNVRCTFQGAKDVHVEDDLRATHLYHIAQEACTNALKHAHAKNIEVYLRPTDHGLVLQIQDDGTGISDDATEGLGMRIMRNRANLIGAELTIKAAHPWSTVVTCTLKELAYAP